MSKKKNRNNDTSDNTQSTDVEVTKDLKKPEKPDSLVEDDHTLDEKIDDAILRGDWSEVTRLRYGTVSNGKPKKAGDPVSPT